MKREILDIDDIKLLVNSFYARVQKDDLLGPIFNGVIKDNWPVHLEKMYRFWQSILLDENTYNGRPFPPHARLPVEKKHFDRWLQLFFETIDGNFKGEKAAEAKWRAERMAEMFWSKIKYFRDHSTGPVL